MKKYVVTSTEFMGELCFKYDLKGDLTGFEIVAALTDIQRKWYFDNLPYKEGILTDGWVKRSRTIKIMEVPEDLSFETFYNLYKYKVGDKKKCIKLWAALKDEVKVLVLRSIPAYLKWLERTGTAQVYPERFLSKEYYINEYK